jgi:hypothetical protein
MLSSLADDKEKLLYMDEAIKRLRKKIKDLKEPSDI